jgi:hypothetical protein
VESAGNFPEFLRAFCGGVNHFSMAAGKRDVFFIADKQNWKWARSDGFHGRNVVGWKSGKFFSAVQKRPRAGSHQGFSEQRICAQACVIVGRFAKIGERGFGDYRFDARIGSGGLQNDSRAHGFPESEEMKWFRRRPRETGRLRRHHHLNIDAREKSRMEQRIDDGAGVVAFEPAVRCDRTFARAVRAGIHHDNAVTGAEKEFGLSNDASAIVGDAVE